MFIYWLFQSNFAGGTRMSQPTSAVSLRITEEDLALLDARVGMDGARNRSDVVRLAIQEFLHNQPLLTGMKSIRIPWAVPTSAASPTSTN